MSLAERFPKDFVFRGGQDVSAARKHVFNPKWSTSLLLRLLLERVEAEEQVLEAHKLRLAREREV